VLRNVSVARHVIEDFRPLQQSLLWRLSALYWNTAGIAPFIRNEAPFVITSNGRLSEDAAAVFFASRRNAASSAPIHVLELGAGCGLFARYFLDAFKAMSSESGIDLYARLAYRVSDRSESMVRKWIDVGLFQDHAEHVVLGTCDAMRPREFAALHGRADPVAPLDAVLCKCTAGN
jgi:hypothetical protein